MRELETTFGVEKTTDSTTNGSGDEAVSAIQEAKEARLKAETCRERVIPG